MFNLQRLKNWTKSSVNDDKKELEIYQLFQDQFNSIKNKSDEYISELGYTDRRLFVNFNGEAVPLSVIDAIKDSIPKNKNLSIQEKAHQVAELSNFYYQKLKEIESRIIDISIKESDNAYLITIANNIKLLNKLLMEYSYLLAIQRSGVKKIESPNTYEKIKQLKDSIEIRIAEIQTRLITEEIHKR